MKFYELFWEKQEGTKQEIKFFITEQRMWKQSQTRNDYNGLDIQKEYINEATKTGPSRADCLEIWQPQCPGMLRASTGIALPLPQCSAA